MIPFPIFLHCITCCHFHWVKFSCCCIDYCWNSVFLPMCTFWYWNCDSLKNWIFLGTFANRFSILVKIIFDTAGEKMNRAADVLYRTVFKRTSTMIVAVVFTAFFFERAVDQACDSYFDKRNEGVSFLSLVECGTGRSWLRVLAGDLFEWETWDWEVMGYCPVGFSSFFLAKWGRIWVRNMEFGIGSSWFTGGCRERL